MKLLTVFSGILPSLVLSVALFSGVGCHAYAGDPNSHLNIPSSSGEEPLSDDPVPLKTREHWMNRAITALADLNDGSPCPFAAFGAVIVNHSAVETGRGGMADVELGLELGKEICIGANSIVRDGNPTLHGRCPFRLLTGLVVAVVLDVDSERYSESASSSGGKRDQKRAITSCGPSLLAGTCLADIVQVKLLRSTTVPTSSWTQKDRTSILVLEHSKH
jgi:hypothetical protein